MTRAGDEDGASSIRRGTAAGEPMGVPRPESSAPGAWRRPGALEEPVIEAREVRRQFGARTAVDGVNLRVHRGEVFGFLGPNGAGKSTLMRMLVGLLSPSAGEVRVLGLEMPRQAEVLREKVGYMPQHFALYDDLSVEENLDFAAQIFGLAGEARRQRVAATLERYSLGERRRQRAATLSGGWKRRLALAAATVHSPELLVLDEPTAGVDPEQRRVFWELIFDLAADGTTVLVSTHYMDEAVRCNRLLMLLAGRRVALGPPAALATRLEGRVVEVWAARPEAAVARLRYLPEVLSVTQLGDLVHVLLQQEGPGAAALAPVLDKGLAAAGMEAAQVRPARPTLEDVFVAATRGEKGGLEEPPEELSEDGGGGVPA